MSDRTATRAAVLLASVLTADALFHLYWATGSTWPAADEKSLSYAVLGTEAPFTPPVLLPLAALLLTASGIVVAQSRRPHRLLRLGTLAVAAGLSLRTLAGVYWLFAQDTGTVFYWLNLGLYTPLCAVLCTAALRVALDKGTAVQESTARWEDAVRVR
ncbi:MULTISPECIES: DUF3995 domain-containing protein [unclassified Streptomyces]|uniref:DUF3995 domain-containing protein n=1 Tax=unclassified Streptomyces TaxID=2593676 RepID=UPI002E808ADF|nr:DUF3995 domain-containing protein [Streptomyces sp. NBC_00589]WTI39154.1 DUF3995 domain-containing protein [Streptomyces sp. NBC_00775]WUB27167.1 DUF3995 domain-containing protein [Streptomyces sp. NBC_00589]